MSRHLTPTTLSPRQHRTVVALLTTGEVRAAAREVGVTRETVHRWLRDPVFLAAVRDAEAAAIDALSRQLVQLGTTAIATITAAMTDPATPAATRVRAADVALNRLLQLRELAQLEARVQALEHAVRAEGAGG